MSVLVVGDLAVIVSSPVSRLPKPGENFLLPRAEIFASGVAANLAWDLRGLSVDVNIVSGVGRDALGAYILTDLEKRGIGVGSVQRSEHPTGTFVILVDETGERTMIGFRGAAEGFPLGLAVLDEQTLDWIHISGYTLLDPVMAERTQELVAEARSRGIPCSIDLEGIAQAKLHTPLDQVTVLCNLDEYRRYFGHRDARPMPRPEPLIVKARERGCFLVDEGTVVSCPAAQVSSVDSTGAGDAFNAGYIAARVRGESARRACDWGNTAAGIAVGVFEPRVDLSAEMIERRLAAGGPHET